MTANPEDMSFLEHLDQLRGVMLKMLLGFLLCCIPCWFLSQPALDALLDYAAPADFPLHYFSLMEPFVTRLKIMAFLAFILTLPFNVRLLWRFLEPGLWPDERKAVLTSTVAICLLAMLGAAIALLFVVPAMVSFSLSFAGPAMQPVIGIGDFTGLVLICILAAMLLFQFPVLLYILLTLGIISLPFLKQKRPHIIVIIFILAAIFSPPDVLSQLLLAIPAWLLLEASILFFSRKFPKKDTSYDDIYADADKMSPEDTPVNSQTETQETKP